MIYGYCRISSRTQNLARQVHNISAAYPDAKIIEEVFTGTKIGRPKFDRLLGEVKPGDTIVFDEVSRMSRNAEEGFETYQKLYTEGVNLVFLKEPEIGTDRYKDNLKKRIGKIETGSKITDKLMNTITDALQEYAMDLAKQQIADAFARSQSEVDYLHKRTKEGIAAAKEAGHIPGRRDGQSVNTRRGLSCKEVMLKTARGFGGNLKDKEVMKLLSCGRNSYYKWKTELMADLDAGKTKEDIIREMKAESQRIEEGYGKKDRN